MERWNPDQGFEDGDITGTEAEEALLRSNQEGIDERSASDIFNDRALSARSKRKRLKRLASNGDAEAVGYLEDLVIPDDPHSRLKEIDEAVAGVCAAVAERMTATGLPGAALREREHLDPFIKDEFEARFGARPVSRTHSVAVFPRLGPVDVVAARPKLMMELKWSFEPPGKVFESLWDAIKLALLGSAYGFEALYVLTGASLEEWERSESADLFSSGTYDPLEMWERRLIPPRGPNYGKTVGEDLIIGAYGNQPAQGPPELLVRSIGAFGVAQDFELRLAGIEPTRRVRAWPQRD